MSRGKETGARTRHKKSEEEFTRKTETIQCYLWKEPCRVTQLCEETRTEVVKAIQTGDQLRKSTGERERERGERNRKIPFKQESPGLPDSRYQVAGSRGRSSSSGFGGRRWHSGRSGRDTWVPLNHSQHEQLLYSAALGSRGVQELGQPMREGCEPQKDCVYLRPRTWSIQKYHTRPVCIEVIDGGVGGGWGGLVRQMKKTGKVSWNLGQFDVTVNFTCYFAFQGVLNRHASHSIPQPCYPVE